MIEPLYGMSVKHKWFSYLRCPEALLSFSVFGSVFDRHKVQQLQVSGFNISNSCKQKIAYFKKQTNSAVVSIWLESQVISGKLKILPGKIQNDLTLAAAF